MRDIGRRPYLPRPQRLPGFEPAASQRDLLGGGGQNEAEGRGGGGAEIMQRAKLKMAL